MISRTERLRIELDLDHDGAHRHVRDLDIVAGKPVTEAAFRTSRAGDTIQVVWEFRLQYLDGIDSKFRALIRILADGGIVSRIDLDELDHAESVFLDLIAAIGQVRRLIEESQP